MLINKYILYMNLFVNMDTYKKPKFMDVYSYTHLILGFVAYFILHKMLKLTINKSFVIWMMLHFIYELKDYYHTYIKDYKIRPNRINKINGSFHSDNSLYNSVGDTLVATIGFYTWILIKNYLLRLVLLTSFSIYAIYMLSIHLS